MVRGWGWGAVGLWLPKRWWSRQTAAVAKNVRRVIFVYCERIEVSDGNS